MELSPLAHRSPLAKRLCRPVVDPHDVQAARQALDRVNTRVGVVKDDAATREVDNLVYRWRIAITLAHPRLFLDAVRRLNLARLRQGSDERRETEPVCILTPVRNPRL